MAILGLGTDIVEIARIEAVISRSGERLARRVLSDNEWDIWETHQQPVRFLPGQSIGFCYNDYKKYQIVCLFCFF